MARILLIDDHQPLRALLRTMLETAGHEVCEAANGREGLALYQERPTDLIITDMAMPEMNGLDLIVELTRQCATVKVIAMSGDYGKDANLDAAEFLGACQTLQKPFSSEKLLSTIRDALAR